MTTKLFRLDALNSAFLWTLALTAAILASLLVGVEPVGGDPDRMYRPIKAELARSFADGKIPYWSDRLGLGFPFVAESHAAAFYPPNQVLYRVLSVPLAYRLSMFLHYLLMAGTTYAYARRLNLTPHGAGLAALCFSFCGFQSIHSSHEWSYHALAYLPLCLFLAERIMSEGRLLWVAALAAAFGVQLSVGHFQVQSWTVALAVATALLRAGEAPWRFRRVVGVLAGLAWGGAIAAAQLGPSWELTRFVSFDDRPFLELAFFGFPPAHWAELVVPGWFRGIPGGPEANYWYGLGTTGYEACFYIGTIPLIFVFLGALGGKDSSTRFWVGASVVTFTLAVLPTLWLQGFQWVTSIPGMGLFRAPGRFLALTSLGLAILAGKGLDRTGTRGTAWLGLALALLFAVGGMWWVVSWSWRPENLRVLGGDRLLIRLAAAGGAWLVAAILTAAWLRGRLPAQALLIVAAAELGALYYTSTTDWGWAVDVPGSSPILSRLAEEKGVGRIAGVLNDIPLRFGGSALFPYTGFVPPPPHWRLAGTTRGDISLAGVEDTLEYFGATHGVWDAAVSLGKSETLMLQRDETLDRIVHNPGGMPAHATWRLVRLRDPKPIARAATRTRMIRRYEAFYTGDPKVVFYERQDLPQGVPELGATHAEVTSWDGATAVVDHDGPCDVVIVRTFYPGWTYRVDDGPERPVARADGGLQAGRVPGAGVHRVTFTYRPTYGTFTMILSAAAGLLAIATFVGAAVRRSSSREQDSDKKGRRAEQHRLNGGVEPGGEPRAGEA